METNRSEMGTVIKAVGVGLLTVFAGVAIGAALDDSGMDMSFDSTFDDGYPFHTPEGHPYLFDPMEG